MFAFQKYCEQLWKSGLCDVTEYTGNPPPLTPGRDNSLVFVLPSVTYGCLVFVPLQTNSDNKAFLFRM